MSELKKCPFCGEEAYVEQIPENTEEERKQHPNWNWNFPGMWVVGCRTPSCLGRIEGFNSVFMSRGTAVKKWNDRPTGKIFAHFIHGLFPFIKIKHRQPVSGIKKESEDKE